MKILNVIQNIDEMSGGGAAERVRQLCYHLSKHKYDITLLTTDYNLSQDNISSLGKVDLIVLPCFIRRFYIPLPLLWSIKNAVKCSDVVHLVSHWTVINAIVYLYVIFYKRPYVISPLGALPIFGRSNFIKRLYNLMIGKSIVRNANICVVATNDEWSALASYGVDQSSVVHIPNGINECDYLEKENTVPSNEFDFLYRSPFILFIGRLNPIKGPDLLMDAFCRVKDSFPGLHLVYVGPDEGMLNSLKNHASGCSVLERTHFLGWVSREFKAAIIHKSLLLVVPSRQEAMSIVVLESGIAGKPVLITDQCGFDEVAQVGGGLIVPATIDGIASGIKKLLDHESDLSLMGVNLRKLVQNNFSWSSAAKEYSLIFDKLVMDNI